MKKILVLLIILLTLSACAKREDYFELGIDDYSISVGYDDCEYLDIAYDFDIKEQLEENEVVEDVNIYLFDKLLGVANITNPKKKTVSYEKGIVTRLELYVNDLKGRSFKLNGQELDKSIKTNCDKFNGTYIEKNGYACVIESNVNDELNVVEMHGDYLNMDQDELDHIIIYVE